MIGDMGPWPRASGRSAGRNVSVTMERRARVETQDHMEREAMSTRRGFTWIELLVVIAIIVLVHLQKGYDPQRRGPFSGPLLVSFRPCLPGCSRTRAT
jgi:prepilin-type N-terminal cleavage/methylation domain-containing protein